MFAAKGPGTVDWRVMKAEAMWTGQFWQAGEILKAYANADIYNSSWVWLPPLSCKDSLEAQNTAQLPFQHLLPMPSTSSIPSEHSLNFLVPFNLDISHVFHALSLPSLRQCQLRASLQKRCANSRRSDVVGSWLCFRGKIKRLGLFGENPGFS